MNRPFNITGASAPPVAGPRTREGCAPNLPIRLVLDPLFYDRMGPAVTSKECPDCEGSGGYLEAVRFTGEAYGCQREVICETCNGLKEIACEPSCSICGGKLIFDACHDCHLVFDCGEPA